MDKEDAMNMNALLERIAVAIEKLVPGNAGAALGSMTSEKKAAAVRENGKLGGRPKLRSQNLHETCPQCFRNAGHAKGCTENYSGSKSKGL